MSDPDPLLLRWDITRLYERIEEMNEIRKNQADRIEGMDNIIDSLLERVDLLESKVEELSKIE